MHYKPNHLLSYYGEGKISLPLTEKIYSELITLPLHPEITIEQVVHICKLINTYLK
jgi:dTDP-4-amino-4,6-dideoxygalactose transaminase